MILSIFSIEDLISFDCFLNFSITISGALLINEIFESLEFISSKLLSSLLFLIFNLLISFLVSTIFCKGIVRVGSDTNI